MALVQKANPSRIQKHKKDDNSSHEEVYLDGIYRVSLKRIMDAVAAGETRLSAKDLFLIHQLRQATNVDSIVDSASYFKECNSCVFYQSCTLFQEGEKCSYDLAKPLNDSEGIVRVMIQLLRIEGDRIQRSLLIEKLEGVIDKEVSSEIMQYFDMVSKLKEALSEEESLSVKHKKSGKITSLFGDLISKANKPQAIEVEAIAEDSKEGSQDESV